MVRSDWIIFKLASDRKHPDYAILRSYGKEIIPFVLHELIIGKGHWFLFLHEVTGVNPVPEEEAGQITKMRIRWINWIYDNT